MNPLLRPVVHGNSDAPYFGGTEKEFILAAYSNGLVLLFTRNGRDCQRTQTPAFTNKSGDKKGDDMEKNCTSLNSSS